MKKLTAIVIGAGDRGANAYAPYALKNPNKLEIVAVAEPLEERRKSFKEKFSLSDFQCYKNYEDILKRDKLADIAIIATQDKMHLDPTLKALEAGYDVLLEKPMSPDAHECIKMADVAEKNHRILSICHVLRYTSFFQKIKEVLAQNRIGDIISINHNENVGYYHQAHSFVRGNWRNTDIAAPMILAKSCHDMDILLYLINKKCLNVSSFGSLKHFKEENAPKGAPMRCLDGCPHENKCPFYAPKFYLTDNVAWPTNTISTDLSFEGRLKALKEGPYGRCVYHCDNNVVDHQVVNLEFEDGVTATFSMCAFTHDIGRTLKIMGSKGEIRANMNTREIEVHNFVDNSVEKITLKPTTSGHGGGDFGLIDDFLNVVSGNNKESLSSAKTSVQSHLMALAAEKSRIEHRIVSIDEFYK
ncbi:Oxidoreductase family, C-terminal alpha/beta domain [Clostridium cadaveris]|uniref:Oxidoreductase family, C-terminal alpha/beta domain n=1 Tax=Clostridium cadaveris TaxID=1529 RepID=A0A1I2PSB2_9CLOT|nr:Gfo/Idh/MocA family oxidoreductase [Clostridium cadaveris]MDM8313042.1 Gfo/Idh/MocA family oxidoreductase [Clostridium cadaveris]SFG18958.1 Oxidoreductase family, C-terminal alpha/beta domain [Clostridium cadaveris]